MTTTPEPAVSPAPDTDALRAYLRRTIGGDFERRLIAADLLDDDDALSVLRVFEDVVPAIEREITSRHQAFVLMLADAKAERDDRIAGLRADLDRARATIAHLQEEVAKQNNRRAVIQGAYQQVWDTIGPVVRYPINPDSPADTIMFSVPDAAEAIVAEVLELRARSAGARTIPDDAAERLTYALFRMSPGLFCDAPVAPINALTAALWKHVWRDLADHERAEWQAYGRTVLAQVLEATPTTGPDDVSLAQYHLSTRLQGVLEEWGIGNGCDRLRLDDIETARLLRQLVAAIPPTTGPAPAAADELREEKGDLLCTLACAIDLLKTHVDDEDCSLDHHGYCQTHGWFDEDDCNVARTRAFLIGASWVPDFNAERFDWAEAAATLVHPAPAAPQAPESGPDCSHCRCARPFHKTCCPTEQAEPMASCGVHTEAEAQTSIRHELCTPAAREDTAPPAQPEGKWNEGDIAYDRTGFVHRRYAQGWRTYPRTTGVQYGDDLMEANLGPLVRLEAVPPGTSDVGALPPGFAREDDTDDLIPDLPKCTVAGCTHIRWRDLDTCQFHVPLKGNVEVRRPSAPRVDGDRPDCTNDLGGSHPSEPGCELNGDPYCRECATEYGPGDQPEESQ